MDLFQFTLVQRVLYPQDVSQISIKLLWLQHFNRLKNQMSWAILGVWGQRKRYACSACTLFNAFLRFPASCSVHFILCLLITSFCLCILNDVDNIWSIFHGAMEDKYPAPMIYLCMIPLMPKWENYG